MYQSSSIRKAAWPKDKRLQDFDVATLVEVIEHLDVDRLESLEKIVFEFAQPKIVIVTTPNRSYNQVYSSLSSTQLRHHDHRFEWTRSEFADWCQSAAETFGYSVELSSLGPEHERLGGPSQMAVFERKVAA